MCKKKDIFLAKCFKKSAATIDIMPYLHVSVFLNAVRSYLNRFLDPFPQQMLGGKGYDKVLSQEKGVGHD